ncbi:hypothetical protein SAMN06296386_11261 [Lachnospiraceae bacterium]|nr:hypothetical protein SAMN06296386_11261 [Lachnospiraceae bacterium]
MIIITLAAVIFITIALIPVLHNNSGIRLIEKESYFDNFEVVDGETRITCVLSIKNNTNKFVSLSVNAIFDQDYQNGLVSDRSVEGVWSDTGAAEISLAPKEKASYKKIVFSSKNAGCDTKTDRNLPEIQLNKTENFEEVIWDYRNKVAHEIEEGSYEVNDGVIELPNEKIYEKVSDTKRVILAMDGSRAVMYFYKSAGILEDSCGYIYYSDKIDESLCKDTYEFINKEHLWGNWYSCSTQ